MKKHLSKPSACLFVLAIGFSGLSCGAAPGPFPEAVLAGTWLAVAQDLGIDARSFVFDEQGRLAEIRSTILNTTFIERNVHNITRVVGNGVFIKTRSELIIEGTLNAELNVITATARTETDLPFTSTTVIRDLGAVTLTKQ